MYGSTNFEFGYDDQDYKSVTPTKEASTGPETENGIVSGTIYVNLREAPTMSRSSLAILKKGTKVKILDKVSGFYKVECEIYPGVIRVGYISSRFIKRGDGDEYNW